MDGPVVAISSMVAKGTVGLRAIMPAMQARQREVVAVPTALLSWHPGHGSATIAPTNKDEFCRLLGDLTGRSEWIGPAAILSGWLADEDQVVALARFVADSKRQRPELIYLCDPVIGDMRGAYRPPAVIDAIAKELLPLADITTPNRFELELLTGRALSDNGALIEAGRQLGVARLIITSAFAMMAGSVGNLLVVGDNALMVEKRVIADAPHGTGDLFSALFLARLLEGQSDAAALSAATASVFEMLARSRKAAHEELALASEQACLVRPMAMVTERRIAMPKIAADG
ncbi:PfkB family carbohydrate kinase [Notoacmeibacter ruber]|uniref:pyridoxal kinase n=1 Tax=Notoacmeibacter ruber TaxID=2670375 RepID=A0A3L7JFB5_9HYPH|nr:PfkB family carbohydrate kinase [Notoacmeibacter ruber]RLQ89019.1 pyridoxal kinase [Notoacmeibacter ruber]